MCIFLSKGNICFKSGAIGIAYMRYWGFRKAQKEYLTISKHTTKYILFGFIFGCYGLLHISSYERTLDDAEDILRRRGSSV